MKLNYQLQGNRLEGTTTSPSRSCSWGKGQKRTGQDLPLGLAVALLSDANGVIQMNLKVKGNLDQPDFSLGNIFWDVLGNTLRKAVTSPSRCLPPWRAAARISMSCPSCPVSRISPPPSRRNWPNWRRPSRTGPSSA